MIIKDGSRWGGSDRKVFIVLNTVEQEGHTWIHYREEVGNPPREYSCYQESFVSRFTALPE